MRKNKKRFSELTSSSAVLQALLAKGKSPLASQFQRWRLWRDWEEVAGKTFAAHSLPVALVNKTLYIWVESSAWLQEFSFFESPLREKINAHFNERWIERIRFTLDRRSVPDPTKSELGTKLGEEY